MDTMSMKGNQSTKGEEELLERMMASCHFGTGWRGWCLFPLSIVSFHFLCFFLVFFSY